MLPKGDLALDHFRSIHIEDQPTIVFQTVTIADERDVNSAVDHYSTLFHGIDILLCFAGLTGCQLPVDYDINEWKKIFDVNVHWFILSSQSGKPSKFTFSMSSRFHIMSYGSFLFLGQLLTQDRSFQRRYQTEFQRVYYFYCINVWVCRERSTTIPDIWRF